MSIAACTVSQMRGNVMRRGLISTSMSCKVLRTTNFSDAIFLLWFEQYRHFPPFKSHRLSPVDHSLLLPFKQTAETVVLDDKSLIKNIYLQSVIKVNKDLRCS